MIGQHDLTPFRAETSLPAACNQSRRSPRAAQAAVSALFFALTLPAVAQEPTHQEQQSQKTPQTTIRTRVNRVIVDVVVTDSQGKLVRGLSADDFVVFEDDAPQQILSFDVHLADSAAEFVPPHLPTLPPNWFVNLPSGPERGPLYVILLDLLHTSTEDQPRARIQLQDFIKAKPEGARFAVFALTDTLHLIQGFTGDSDRLLAAVSPKTSRLPHIFLYADNFSPYVSGLRALLDIGRFLSGLPGRKNLIWISGDFPYFTVPDLNPGLRMNLPASSAPLRVDSANPFFVGDDIRAAIDTLARAQTAVYPVDARGVTGAAHPSARPALYASYMVEDTIAEETGGHAFYSNNDLAGALAEAADSGANYYTLSYSPSNQKDDGKLRRIRVETSRHGCHLTYRHSYYLRTPDAQFVTASRKERELLGLPGVIQPGDSLYANMQHGAPIAHDLIFSAHLQSISGPSRPTAVQVSDLAEQPAYFKGSDKKPDKSLSTISLQTYAVDFRITAAQLTRAPSELELALAAFDEDGLMLNAVVQKADADPPQEQKQPPQVFTIREQIDVPAKAAWLRFAVRDNSTGRIGATEIPLPPSPEVAR